MKKIALLLFIFGAPIGDFAATTVPFILDHNRILIPADVYLPNGQAKHITVWVDNSTPVLAVSDRLARELRLEIKITKAGDKNATPPKRVLIGGLQLDLSELPSAEVDDGTTVGSGMNADMNLPASVLCEYDIVVDYPLRRLTIAARGSVTFSGTAVRGYFNPKNHLIQLPAGMDGVCFNLALDVGTPVAFIDSNLLSKFSMAHPSWPSLQGAVGIANVWGLDDEPELLLLRMGKLTFGNMVLQNAIAVSFPVDRLDYFQKRAGIPTAGLMGAASLLNYKLGIDYGHGIVYFEKIMESVNPNMSLIGITLRPEADGSYHVLSVSSYRGRPAVTGIVKGDKLLSVNDKKVTGLTMGAVWALLGGEPGTTYTLKLSRQGKEFSVPAPVYCFL